MKKKILASIATIGAVASLAVFATGAFFSDTETSVDNTFKAGAIDLKIDNESYVDQGQGLLKRTDLSWGENVSADGTAVGKFFDIEDLKPGDNGEDTISIHLTSNPAWVCVDLDITENSDVDCTEPESEAENNECTPESKGDIAKDLNFAFWMDDGDNVYEAGEQLLTQGPASNVLGGMTWALFDSQTGSKLPMEPTSEGEPYYIGKAWCYGTLSMTPVTQDVYDHPTTDVKGYTCDGSLVGNEGQTDLLKGDITFRAVQSRHNDGFVCTRPNPEPSVTPNEVYDYLNIGDETSEAGHSLSGWSNAWKKPGWGGVYGGGSSDTSFRLLMGAGDSCEAYDATFVMHAGAGYATQLTLEHLNGVAMSDSFDVYVNDVKIGSYADDVTGTEIWETTTFTFDPVTGDVTVKLVAVNPDLAWCATWGQVAFSNAKLE